MTNQLTVSLSRAHKIAERLKDCMKTSLSEAEAKATPVTFSAKPSQSNVDEIAVNGTQYFEHASEFQMYADAWAAVRQAIAVENHKRGIDAKLVRLETLNKVLALHKRAVAASKLPGYLPNEAENYKPDQSTFSRYGLVVNPLRNDGFSKKALTALGDTQRQVIQLSDEISTANGPQVTLTLDPKIIAEVTGAVPA